MNINKANNSYMKTRRDLTQEEKDQAKKLRRIWEQKKRERKFTQDDALETLGFQSQGAVSQHLNGLMALNTDIIIKFSRFLGIDPREIRSDLNLDYLANYIQEQRAIYDKYEPISKIPVFDLSQEIVLENDDSDNHKMESEAMPFEISAEYANHQLFGVKILDNSIIKETEPGYTLVFSKDIEPKNNDIVIVKINNLNLIMRYAVKPSGTFLEDLGDIPYPPIDAKNAEIIGVQIAKTIVEYKKR